MQFDDLEIGFRVRVDVSISVRVSVRVRVRICRRSDTRTPSRFRL